MLVLPGRDGSRSGASSRPRHGAPHRQRPSKTSDKFPSSTRSEHKLSGEKKPEHRLQQKNIITKVKFLFPLLVSNLN